MYTIISVFLNFFRKLRRYIDNQNSKFVEKEKEAKERVLAAKDKVMQLITNWGFRLLYNYCVLSSTVLKVDNWDRQRA